ncbi:PTS sugar transporter subunit IIA, partial [Xenorhabdus bovienii]|nr:PTS sugar transporter subunit IIA [Xenorhabdus bovienii]
MKITELLKRDTVIMDMTASNKEAVIDELVEKLNGANRLNSKTEFKEAILKRES